MEGSKILSRIYPDIILEVDNKPCDIIKDFQKQKSAPHIKRKVNVSLKDVDHKKPQEADLDFDDSASQKSIDVDPFPLLRFQKFPEPPPHCDLYKAFAMP